MKSIKEMIIDRKDKNNWYQMRLGNSDLMLIEDSDGKLKIAILNTKKTWGFIFTNINEHNRDKNKCLAVGLFGEEFELEKVVDKELNFTTYYYNNQQVRPLYDYAKESNVLPFIVKKYSALDKYNKNSWFSYLELRDELQTKINEEFKERKHLNLQNKTKNIEEQELVK